ncbi:MAG TPA: Asp-tRNA(Asn)/Glu-tRNA(Gln) amidotransferase subunit GatB, partial [Candidatus Yonathbacteria bacterium]|nr:Asp-tRNA(Asn)/Glu-tRNA(Gln) amidotransferase subunit GatB [Candidatus Yonathbacteria bacterium]
MLSINDSIFCDIMPRMTNVDYKPTIGLEIHAELKTETKMFCNSKNNADEKTPNTNICPVCMAHPGTLPVINKEAVRQVLRVGTALKGNLADFTEFDRKNYFYPDIPKGYQISQYKYPLVSGGVLNGIEVTRVHLEEDTARSSHDKGDYTLLDFNRAGVPLMELVTEPVVKDSKEAGNFARELQLLLRTLGASDANMEKGEMRVEANVSVMKRSVLEEERSDGKGPTLGTKVEVKNINSFKAVESAIEYEIARQIKELEAGGEVVQETRGWDENKGKTFRQRSKEDAHDYRYFPDPDLPKLRISKISDFAKDVIAESMPELPWKKRATLKDKYGLKDEDIEMFVRMPVFGDFLEKVLENLGGDKKKIQLASNYITSDLVGLMKDNLEARLPSDFIKPNYFAELINMVEAGEVSSRGAKDILKAMFGKDENPREIAKEKSLFQESN